MFENLTKYFFHFNKINMGDQFVIYSLKATQLSFFDLEVLEDFRILQNYMMPSNQCNLSLNHTTHSN